MEVQRKREARRRKQAKERAAARLQKTEVDPVPGRQHIEVQTDVYVSFRSILAVTLPTIHSRVALASLCSSSSSLIFIVLVSWTIPTLKRAHTITHTYERVHSHAHHYAHTQLEELTDRVEEVDMAVQTDPFLDRAPDPVFIPAKTGVDAHTQIADGELFDFDLEARPVLEVLVGKTMEQAMMEVLEGESCLCHSSFSRSLSLVQFSFTSTFTNSHFHAAPFLACLQRRNSTVFAITSLNSRSCETLS